VIIPCRAGRTVAKTPKPGFARPGYRGTSAGGTMLTDAVPPTLSTMPLPAGNDQTYPAWTFPTV